MAAELVAQLQAQPLLLVRVGLVRLRAQCAQITRTRRCASTSCSDSATM